MFDLPQCVAPFTGAWIEIGPDHHRRQELLVAPFTGAWIEIPTEVSNRLANIVAPFTGAWIEIMYSAMVVLPLPGRTLHGCVD